MSIGAELENVLILVLDALRRDRVGTYGSDRGLTPNIDGLAEQNVVFERAFTCINATDPSITSLHTGRLPRATVLHHGGLVTEEEKRRIESAEVLPERLSDAGINTVATGRVMGRWHRRGFDEYAWDSVEATETRISRRLKMIHPLLHRVAATTYNAVFDRIGDGENVNVVDKFLDATGEKPYYGFVHLMDTHAWYDAEEGLVDELLQTNDYPDGDLQEFFEDYAESPIVSKLLEPNATRADYEHGLARLYARYDATVREADEIVAQLIEGLKARGDWGNTALFVLSDHGESLHEHGIYFDHHGLYDETVRVPLVAHIPGIESVRVDDFVQLHDLAPTILDLFGFDGLPDADGRSLIDHLDSGRESSNPRVGVLVEEAHTQRRLSFRTKRYKFIEHVHDETVADFWDTDSIQCGYCRRHHADEVELYDLRRDPDETENLADERPAMIQDLRGRLTDRLANVSTVSVDDVSVSYKDEDEVMERLRDLGYR